MSSSYSMPGPWPGGWQQGRAPWLDHLQELAAMAQRHMAFDAESDTEEYGGRRRHERGPREHGCREHEHGSAASTSTGAASTSITSTGAASTADACTATMPMAIARTAGVADRAAAVDVAVTDAVASAPAVDSRSVASRVRCSAGAGHEWAAATSVRRCSSCSPRSRCTATR